MPIPVSLSDLLEFKVKGSFAATMEINNLFHYQVNSVTGGDLLSFAAGLADKLHDNIWGSLSSQYLVTSIEARLLDANGNLVNGETLIIGATYGVGGAGGDSLPPNVCYTFKYLRADSSFRHGFKRFTGVTEGNQANGILASSAITAVNTMADDLVSFVNGFTLTVGGDPDTADVLQSMVPIVLQRVINGDPIQPINFYQPTDVVFDRIGTQNSRKYGVGS